MADLARPDLLIVGDSHSVALHEGCAANGLDAAMLSFSGNFWHEGFVSLHAEHGIWVRGRAMQERVLALRERLGGASLLSPGLPVVASIGFHLGRMVPPFGFRNHVSDAERFLADETRQFASSGLIAAYARFFRAAHVRMLRRIDRLAPLVAVAPPHVYTQPNYAAFLEAIAAMLRDARIRFYDPWQDLGLAGGSLPDRFLAEDGVHGNAAYGKAVVANMIRQGLIARPGR